MAISALGNYVHLRYRNYEKYGVAKIGQSPVFLRYQINAIQNRINRQVKSVNQSAIQELERRLKLNSESNLEKGKTEQEKRQQELIDQIYTLLYERSRQVRGAKRLQEVAKGNYWTSEKGRKNITKIDTNMHWASSKSLDELKEDRKKSLKIYDKINKLIDKINKQQKGQASIKDLEKLEKLYQDYTHLSYDSNQHTFAAIEKAILENRYIGLANEISGRFGEMMVSICDDKVFKSAHKSAYEAIKQGVKGDQTTEILIDKNLFSNDLDFYNNSTKNDATYSLGATKNKVDVQININDETLFASVKSYRNTNQHYTRPDLQDVNLLTTLAFLNNYSGLENIGNHWINRHAHLKLERSTGAQLVDNIIKKQVAYQALSSGNPFKQGVNSANVFVFINRGTGQVFVKSIKDIIFNEFSTIGGLDVISHIKLKNEYAKTPQERIKNILQQLHEKNIHVALNIKF